MKNLKVLIVAVFALFTSTYFLGAQEQITPEEIENLIEEVEEGEIQVLSASNVYQGCSGSIDIVAVFPNGSKARMNLTPDNRTSYFSGVDYSKSGPYTNQQTGGTYDQSSSTFGPVEVYPIDGFGQHNFILKGRDDTTNETIYAAIFIYNENNMSQNYIYFSNPSRNINIQGAINQTLSTPKLMNCNTQTGGNRILADGYFNDWASIPVTYMDASNDGGSNGVNFGELKVANDPEYLFFTFTTGVELNLSLGNRIVNNDWGPAQGITIYLDTDNNANTGFRINGIGAEFEYNFGAKRGNFYNGSQTPTPITWDQLGTAISLVSVPAISSNQFEIAINRNNTVSGTRVFPNNSNNIKIVLRDNTPNGDMMPAAGQTINYSFTSGSLASLPSYSFSKLQNTDVRVMCYNTEFNSIIDSLDYTDEYQRIFAATQPEIIAFQEIWHKFDDNHPTSQDLANRMNTLYPIAGGWQYHQRYGADIVLLSKYPIRQHAYIQGNDPGTEGSGAGAFLIDLPNNSKDLLVINAHPPHGMQHVPRQKEIDLIMQWLRRAKAGQGPWALPANTPFTIMGDMNLVGNDEDVRTFVTGDIVDPQYGPDFKPDWDGSDLVHVNNHMAEAPFAFTWYDIPYDPPFPPAKLDGVFYSDSQMSLPNQFGLFTPTLSSSTLNATGLRANDVPLVSDHIPLIMDFRIRN